jgi:hypothetical protein
VTWTTKARGALSHPATPYAPADCTQHPRIQIVTGVVLAMHYTAHVDHAFASVIGVIWRACAILLPIHSGSLLHVCSPDRSPTLSGLRDWRTQGHAGGTESACPGGCAAPYRTCSGTSRASASMVMSLRARCADQGNHTTERTQRAFPACLSRVSAGAHPTDGGRPRPQCGEGLQGGRAGKSPDPLSNMVARCGSRP